MSNILGSLSERLSALDGVIVTMVNRPTTNRYAEAEQERRHAGHDADNPRQERMGIITSKINDRATRVHVRRLNVCLPAVHLQLVMG